MSVSRAAARLAPLLDLLRREDSWLIVVNADPDAIASAMALKRLFARRTRTTDIARINEIQRPDNLAMIHDLRIPLLPWREDLCAAYQRFALVDSQPSHNERFQQIPFSIVIDHHPLDPSQPVTAAYTDIRPEMGATSTILTEYLRALDVRLGARLATALQYGIRTDTASFARKATAADLRAYQYLTRHADASALNRIMQSEYLRSWLKYFSRAFASLHSVGKNGGYSFLGEVETPDLLVVIADFFSRVHGLAWIAVAGVYRDANAPDNAKIVVIFRGDGRRDLGKFAHDRMNALGSAGGHRNMARAEFPLDVVEKGRQIEAYVYSLLQ
ncbi:MAG TPA: DHH family phosphoesterase [Candidatus Avidesulfovibrio excrementigallinarum]|nr:DHH family phosphoesterase [Candidatus Avidesulfovibrio excrementigallinarum]